MDFIPELDDSLSVKDKVKLLEQARRQIWDSIDDPAEERPELLPRDAALLRRYAAEGATKLREAAIGILAEYGPVSWEDAERLTPDEDEEVREAAFFAIDSSYYAPAKLCATDKPRCAQMFVTSAKRYGGFPVEAWTMCEDDQWLDLMWSHLGPLLDLGDPELSSNIICGILEDILVYERITFGDPRLQSWIKGDSVERKMALLSVVQWFGMKKPWQRKIAEALTDDPAEVVSSTARRSVAGKPVPDIQMRGWAE